MMLNVGHKKGGKIPVKNAGKKCYIKGCPSGGFQIILSPFPGIFGKSF